MKPICLIPLLVIGLCSCRENGMPARYRSSVMVERMPVTAGTRGMESVHKEMESAVQQQEKIGKAGYHIIVASFSTEEKKEAEAMVSRLRSKDYPASLVNSSKRYRISIESFRTEEEALAARERYRKKEGRKDAWILKAD